MTSYEKWTFLSQIVCELGMKFLKYLKGRKDLGSVDPALIAQLICSDYLACIYSH
jgi:hypothetical protein